MTNKISTKNPKRIPTVTLQNARFNTNSFFYFNETLQLQGEKNTEMKQLKSSKPCLKKIPYKFQRKSLNSTPFYEIKTLAQKELEEEEIFQIKSKTKKTGKIKKMKSQHFPSQAGFNFKFQMPKLYCYKKNEGQNTCSRKT